ncbi:MAG TPA: chromate resistance protein ChrB domain-containing protein [Usitatibacter sp.]|jgi:rhodanese-related sulfurtransferase
MNTTAVSLYSKLGTADAPFVLDVRRETAFNEADTLIASAMRADEDPLAFAWKHAQGCEVVVYCVHGHEVSQDIARTLCGAGLEASYLEGGIADWIAAKLPTIRKRLEWRVPGGSRWITRERPKIDRVACPWLIRRLIDPLASFDYVPTARVFEEAKSRNAVPYDIPGAVVTHRGDHCSFDALIEDFALDDPALDRLAMIVRGADTDRHDLAPQCAGLVATSLGLSRRFTNDHEMLEEAMPMYDALYAWCRAEQQGDHERHDWKPGA